MGAHTCAVGRAFGLACGESSSGKNTSSQKAKTGSIFIAPGKKMEILAKMQEWTQSMIGNDPLFYSAQSLFAEGDA
jgi:hypothetical protein